MPISAGPATGPGLSSAPMTGYRNLLTTRRVPRYCRGNRSHHVTSAIVEWLARVLPERTRAVHPPARAINDWANSMGTVMNGSPSLDAGEKKFNSRLVALCYSTCFGPTPEWHVELRKSLAKNEMCKKASPAVEGTR
jgi:hypothetical protein